MSVRRRLLSLALAPAIAASLAPIVTPAATAAGATVDAASGADLMRLTNADRAAAGLPALAVDPTLVSLATDHVFSCPSDASLRPAGRSLDMAARGYFDHAILGCHRADGSGYTALDVLFGQLGYNTYRGENIGWNGYPADLAVAGIEQAFMASPGHRANILGHYDRLGCGAAVTPAGTRYFTCLFSLGGPALPAPAATRDTTRPTVSGLSGVSGSAPRYRSRALGATFRDDRGLRRATLYIDGRYVAAWALSGTSASRSIWLAAWRSSPGRHAVTWTVWDAAGNSSVGRATLIVR